MYKPARSWRSAWFLPLAGLLLLSANLVFAQAGRQIVLQAPDTSHFPTLTLNFEAYSAQGAFLTGLQAGDVQVMENEAALPAAELSQQQPGLQVVVAIAPGPTLALSTNNLTRLDQLKQALASWASGQAAGSLDDFNFVASGSSFGAHMANAESLAQGITAYAPDLVKATPGINSLIQALDLASDPLPRPQMKRAILYITPLLPETTLAALPNLADRASQQGVRVFVWLVLPPGPAGESKVGTALADLATHTGGQLFTFTGSEQLPDPESYFQPLRYYYRLNYASAIRKAGTYSIAVQVKNQSQLLTSPAQSVTLDLQPPNPMFLDPPQQIELKWSQPVGDASPVLEPTSATIRILIEFKDGFQRQLKATRLFVDGKLVSERTRGPFTELEWPVSQLTSGEKHSLRLEVEDELGLAQSSIETSVTVVIPPVPATGPKVPAWVTPQLLLAVAGVLGGGVLGGGGFILLRRRRQAGPPRPAKAPKPAKKEPGPCPRQAIPLPAARRFSANASAPARLMRISESGHILPASAIPLAAPDLSIGSDAKKALYVIGNPTVSGLHARLRHTEGKFYILDAGSEAGTWVNCQPVSKEGMRLQHGDLVQFGLESFRFELNQPEEPPQVTVSPWEE